MSTADSDAASNKNSSGAAGSAGRQGTVAGVVRTRFAPSPTGFMHVGSARTALFAWLVARQAGGQFILRLEDTDQAREVEGSDKHIMEVLSWLGLDWDEGPDKDGPHGPYRQSQRLETYKRWADKLVQDGRAYADPYSESELNALREQAKSTKKPFLFREYRPDQPPTWDGSQPLRFKSDPKEYAWHDEVMGQLSAAQEAIDDFILIKSDGFPTYNFAHVIDDETMQVSHVIRSQEFLPSVPKFLNLYDALGIDRPKLATLPYVMGPDGTKKLSKRDGAKDILDYAKESYLPDAVINYLASLGWNDGSEQEIFRRQELIENFSLSRVQKSGAHFDEDKLSWVNWQHFKLALEDGKTDFICTLPQLDAATKDKLNFGDSSAAKLAASKASSVEEFNEQLKIFIEAPTRIAADTLSLIDASLNAEQATSHLKLALNTLGSVEPFEASTVETALRGAMEQHQLPPRIFLNLVRWSVSGRKVSPSLFDMLAVLGKSETLSRLNRVMMELAN